MPGARAQLKHSVKKGRDSAKAWNRLIPFNVVHSGNSEKYSKTGTRVEGGWESKQNEAGKEIIKILTN